MCGIIGIFSLVNGGEVCTEDIVPMLNAVIHRGPDHSDIFADGVCGMGHSRLSIVDQDERSNQPFSCPNKRYYIVFNGQIYNFKQLREELGQEHFRTSGDTEIVLLAFIKWGKDFLNKLNGMFALCIYDSWERKLFLARDRFGEKPLYFAVVGNKFYFSSEMKGITASKNFSSILNEEAFLMEIADPAYSESQSDTYIKNIKRVLQGHLVEVEFNGSVNEFKWWNYWENRSKVTIPNTFEGKKDYFKELLSDSVKIRIGEGVSNAITVSGGLDSSTLFLILKNFSTENDFSSFIGQVPFGNLDESKYAFDVIKDSGIRNYTIQMLPYNLEKRFSETIKAIEHVTTGPQVMMSELYSSQAKNGIKVSIDGHGGDELLGGYPYHANYAISDFKLIDYFTKLPKILKVLHGFSKSPGDSGPKISIMQEILKLIYHPKKNKAFDFATSFLEKNNIKIGRETPHNIQSFEGHRYYDVHMGMLPYVLRNYDRVSMLHGIEVRSPFLDWRLVSFCLQLGFEDLFNKGVSKFLLRESYKDYLPLSIVKRTDKIGFTVPVSQWVKNEWKGFIENTIYSADFIQNDLWKAKEIQDFYQNNESWTWQNWSVLWRYINAHHLLVQFKIA